MKDKKTLIYEKYMSTDGNFNKSKFARSIGTHRCYVSKLCNQIKNGWTPEKSIRGNEIKEKSNPSDEEYKEKCTIDYRDNSACLETNTLHIKSAEDACEYAGVDMEIWEIERQVINFWDVTMKLRNDKFVNKKQVIVEDPHTARNYQIKVWLRRIKKQKSEQALERLVERMPAFKYSKFVPIHLSSRSGNLLEVAPLDAHLGKLAWALETQQRDYDLPIAVNDYEYACSQNLTWGGPFNPEKIIYILGQDLMHTENIEGTTPKAGHVLDVDSRLDKLIDATIDVTIKNIYKCRSVAPTEIVLIPGNHDMHASKWLARAVREHFRDDKHVEVDCGPANRKARLWGRTLVGWCHEIPPSKAAAYANEMAMIFRELWAKAEFVEWHHGHKHKKQETKTMPVVTHGGMLMRQLTALSPIDFWHYDNLFTDAVPGGESFVWNKNQGVIANFVAWTNHLHREGD